MRHFACYVDGRLYDDGVPSDDAYPVDTSMEVDDLGSRRAAMRGLARAGKAQAAKRRQQFLSRVLNARNPMEFARRVLEREKSDGTRGGLQ